MCAKSLQPSPTLWEPMDYSLSVSTVHGILQARILEWVAVPSSSLPRDWIHISYISCIGRQVFCFTTNTTWEALFPDDSVHGSWWFPKSGNGSIAAPIQDGSKRQCWWQIFPVGRTSSSTTCYSFCLEGEMTRDVALPSLWTVALQIQLSDEVFWNYKVYFCYWNLIVSLNILFLHVYYLIIFYIFSVVISITSLI